MESYRTNGTCCREIIFEVNDDGTLSWVKFVNGCSGNTQGIARLCAGKPIDEIISTLKGIQCRGNTSCPDQLAKALLAYKMHKSEK